MALYHQAPPVRLQSFFAIRGDPIPLSSSVQTVNHLNRRSVMPLVVEAKAGPRTESAKIRNRKMRKKFTGTPTKPRLSVFCSDKQLYAVLVDDQNKKSLFYGSTLQKSIRGEPPCSNIEAARRVGEDLIQACVDLDIHEISSYDRNGFARGERMEAFEIAISQHGFLLR